MALGPLGVTEKPDMGLWMPWRSLEYSVAETYGQWGPWREHVTVNIPWMFFYCGHGLELQQQTFHWGDLTLQTFNDRRKFRSQTSDSMDRWKAEQGRGREKRKIRREKSRRERVRRKKMEMREKVGKSRFTVFFPMICGSGGSKSRLAKAAGAEPAGQMRDEKVHAVVARSTFWSQNVQSTPFSDHFWKLRCRKSARRCGAKHISKSKCTKHLSSGPLLEVEMSQKCTPLWREAHFEVKMLKYQGFGPLLEVQISKKCTPLWREAHFEVNMLKTQGFGPLLEVQMSLRVAGARDCAPCQKWAKREGIVAFWTTTTTTPDYTPIHYTTPQLQLQLHLHYILLHYTPLHYTALNYTQLHYTTLHYTTLHSTTLHYITLHTLHYHPLHFTTLHYTTLHYATTTTTPLH